MIGTFIRQLNDFFISISKAHQESMSLIKYFFHFVFAFLVFGATKNGFIEWGNDEKFWEKEIIYFESLHAHIDM